MTGKALKTTEIDEKREFVEFGAGKKPYAKLSKELIEKTLHACHGNLSLTARTLDASYCGVKKYLDKYPELKLIREKHIDARIDLAEDKLQENVINNQQAAIEYTLDNLGKNRGFSNDINLNVITQKLEPIVREIINIINNTVTDADQKNSILGQLRKLIHGNDRGRNNTSLITD